MSVTIQEHNLVPTKPLAYRKKTTEIVLHCTASRVGKPLTVEAIDKDHKKNRGFNMIGYQFVIYADGSVHRGRPETSVGGHCTDHNSISIGISYVGGLDENGKPMDTRTPEQCFAMYDLVHHFMLKYGIPLSKVFMHRDLCGRKKACPCFEKEQFDKEFVEYFGDAVKTLNN